MTKTTQEQSSEVEAINTLDGSNEYTVTFPHGQRPVSNVGAVITVEWGYESHSIQLSPRDWSKVKGGDGLGIEGAGYFYEGEFFQDYWDFDGGLDGRLEVSYGDDGGCGFDGHLSDAAVEEI